MREHQLKTWPEPFKAMMAGYKVHEYRRDDRKFEVGDVLVLQEWAPTQPQLPARAGEGKFTGREIRCRVTYISRAPHWGIPEGYVVMSLVEL